MGNSIAVGGVAGGFWLGQFLVSTNKLSLPVMLTPNNFRVNGLARSLFRDQLFTKV